MGIRASVSRRYLPIEPGVPRRAARHDVASFHAAQERLIHAAQLGGPFGAHDPAAERVADGFRLFGYLLEHEVRESAALDVGKAEGNLLDALADRGSFQRLGLEPVPVQKRRFLRHPGR